MWIAANAPNWTDVLSGVGQATGSLFTFAAVAVAVWLGARDRKWRREEQTDRDAAQARLVTVEMIYGAVGYDDQVILVRITNRSTEPIFEFDLVDVESLGHDGHPWHVDYGPHDPPEAINGQVLAAGELFQFPIAYVNEQGHNVTVLGGDRATILFTDAQGLRWWRCGATLPVRIVAPEFPRTYWWHGPWWRLQARLRRLWPSRG